MPKIPDATRIDRSQFSDQRAVVTTDVASAGAGYKSLGAGIQEASRDLKYVDDVNRRSKIAEADLIMSTAIGKAARAFDDRTDFDNFNNEFETDVEEARGIAAGVVDERDRAMWSLEQEPRIEQARGRVSQVRQLKWRDSERAKLSTQLELASDAAVTGDLAGLGVAVDHRLDAAYSAGVMDAEEVAETKRVWREKAALGRLAMMDESEAYNALFQPAIVESLSPKTLGTLRQQYKTVAEENSALREFNALVASEDATEVDVLSKIWEVPDLKKQQKMLALHTAYFTRNRIAKNNQDSDVYNRISAELRDAADRGAVDDYVVAMKKDPSYMTLDESVKRNIDAGIVAFRKGAPRTTNDPSVLETASALRANKQWDDLQEFLNLYGSGLKPSTYDTYLKAAQTKESLPTDKVNTVIDAVLPGTENSDRRKFLNAEIDEWLENFEDVHGRSATMDDVRNEVKRWVTEIPAKDYIAGFIDKKVSPLDADEEWQARLLFKSRKAELQLSHPDEYNAILNRGGLNQLNDRWAVESMYANEIKIQSYKRRSDELGKRTWKGVEEVFKTKGISDVGTVPQKDFISVYREVQQTIVENLRNGE